MPNAVRNWTGLRPEERWWLYTATAAASGRPDQFDIGWRKALRFALTENPLEEAQPSPCDQTAAGARPRRRRRSSRTMFPGFGRAVALSWTKGDRRSH